MPAANVSVIVPCFNAEATVERAINSALAQTLPPAEIIVVDDKSTDSSRDILTRFVETGQIKLICQPKNRGVSAARNAALAVARGRYVAFLDADDEWLPEKLARQVPLLEANSRMSMVGSKLVVAKLEGTRHVANQHRQPTAGREAWKRMLEYSYFVPSGVIVRRSVLNAVGGFDEALCIAEDQDLFIRAALAGDVGFVDEVLGIMHEQPQSLSRRHRALETDIILPMIERYCRSLAPFMTGRERRRVLSRRYSRMGRDIIAASPAQSLRLLCRALASGVEPRQNLRLMLLCLRSLMARRAAIRHRLLHLEPDADAK